MSPVRFSGMSRKTVARPKPITAPIVADALIIPKIKSYKKAVRFMAWMCYCHRRDRKTIVAPI